MIVKICEIAQFTRATPGSSLVYHICEVVCLRLDHEQCHEEMSFCWSWLGPSSGSGTWRGFVSAAVSPLPGCRCCCCRNHPRPWRLGVAGQVEIGLAHDKGWGLQHLRGWSPNKQIENMYLEVGWCKRNYCIAIDFVKKSLGASFYFSTPLGRVGEDIEFFLECC